MVREMSAAVQEGSLTCRLSTRKVVPAPSAVEEGVCGSHPAHDPPQVLNNNTCITVTTIAQCRMLYGCVVCLKSGLMRNKKSGVHEGWAQDPPPQALAQARHCQCKRLAYDANPSWEPSIACSHLL